MEEEKVIKPLEVPGELVVKKPRGRPTKKVADDLIAKSVADLIENDPKLSPEEAVQQMGYRFGELSKGTKEQIRKGWIELVQKFHLGDPAALKTMVETIHMAVLTKAMEKGDTYLMLQVADRIAKRPDVGLDGQSKAPEVTITFEGLEKAIEHSKDLGDIIEIKPKDELK